MKSTDRYPIFTLGLPRANGPFDRINATARLVRYQKILNRPKRRTTVDIEPISGAKKALNDSLVSTRPLGPWNQRMR